MVEPAGVHIRKSVIGDRRGCEKVIYEDVMTMKLFKMAK